MLGVIDKCALPVSADEKISGILGHGSGSQFTEGYFESVRDSDKLVRIADAFEISFSELAARAMAENPGNFFVCGYGERAFIDYPQHGFTIQSLSPQSTSQRDFFFGKMTIKPFTQLKRWRFRENSSVAIFLETGTLEITYGDQRRNIHANESVYFDADVPHKIKNIDSIEAKLFIVTCPALF